MKEFQVFAAPNFHMTQEEAEDAAQKFADMEGREFNVYVLVTTVWPTPKGETK